jgi:hypothetical protein
MEIRCRRFNNISFYLFIKSARKNGKNNACFASGTSRICTFLIGKGGILNKGRKELLNTAEFHYLLPERYDQGENRKQKKGRAGCFLSFMRLHGCTLPDRNRHVWVRVL